MTILTPPTFDHAQPILIDVHHLDETELPPENNLVGLLFRIERSREIETAIGWIRKMNERLLEIGEASLKRSITQWLLHYFLPTRMPRLDFENYKTIQEIIMTSEELTIDFSIPIREEGIRIGIEKGVEQGMEKGTFSVLVKLLERRLGNLSPELLGQLGKAGLPTLNRLVDLAMDVESLEQVEAVLKD